VGIVSAACGSATYTVALIDQHCMNSAIFGFLCGANTLRNLVWYIRRGGADVIIRPSK
jgi:hypothetical protein